MSFDEVEMPLRSMDCWLLPKVEVVSIIWAEIIHSEWKFSKFLRMIWKKR